jgi:hypothetical protein
VVSIEGRSTSLDFESAVVIVSSCEEGAGAPLPVKRERFMELLESWLLAGALYLLIVAALRQRDDIHRLIAFSSQA